MWTLYMFALFMPHINNWITVFGPDSHTDRIFLRMNQSKNPKGLNVHLSTIAHTEENLQYAIW